MKTAIVLYKRMMVEGEAGEPGKAIAVEAETAAALSGRGNARAATPEEMQAAGLILTAGADVRTDRVELAISVQAHDEQAPAEQAREE